MYVCIKLLRGFNQPLWYRVPPEFVRLCNVGTIVRVPLRTTKVAGAVIAYRLGRPTSAYEIRDIDGVEPFPPDAYYNQFIAALAAYHRVDQRAFVRRVVHFLGERANKEAEGSDTDSSIESRQTMLTDEQRAVVDFIMPAIERTAFTPVVLHGVTGSGKTEVYKKLLLAGIKRKKSSILLLPEVTLALEFERRLRDELDGLPIFGFHSGTTPKEKQQLWQRLVSAEPIVIVGVHLPVLLPIANLGLIVVDEEHEVGYQEKKHPRVHTRDAAIMRAYQHGIPIVLGSATPSLVTMHNAKMRGWHVFRLNKRFAGTFPSIEVVPLMREKKRKHFWISRRLQEAIRDRLSKGEQAIIFLNRRGYSFFVQCKECSYIFGCQSCSVSLTLHGASNLRCHYCGYGHELPASCPKCQASAKTFIKKGLGTQQVVSILEQLFPTARIARADLDTSTKKGRWRETVRKFSAGEIDIMVGTQTVTKGYDFPNVTLIGIVWADLDLHFPIYNAAETTMQQLIQVAGRAGRRRDGSVVIAQTLAEDALFCQLGEEHYEAFCQNELGARQQLSYPPYGRLAEIELRNECEQTVEREAGALGSRLRAYCPDGVMVLGPSRPPIGKLKNTHIRRIYLKAPNMGLIHAVVEGSQAASIESSVIFTPNPVT